MLSLLWPDCEPQPKTGWELQSQCVRDLEFDHILSALAQDAASRTAILSVANQLCTDPVVIRYRQDVIEDLWQHPALADRLETLLPDIGALDAYRSSVDRQRSTLQDVTWRLGELEQLVTCISGLSEVLVSQGGEPLKAQGWLRLRDHVVQIAQDEVYLNLTRELPEMLQTIRAKASVTIGVNLDNRLRPVAATLLSVNDQPFTASSFIDRLMGKNGEAFKGLGPLHTVPALEAVHSPFGLEPKGHETNPMLIPLFRDLAKVLETVCQPIAKSLRRYVTLQSSFLAGLSGQMAFYLAAVRLMQRLREQGLPLCRPEIAPMHERICELHESYNLNLALHLIDEANADDVIVKHIVVKNDVHMDANGRIAILTGPNQGGKTTYVQMVGLCQILAQLGLWLPAAKARLSPVDGIYTHYPIEETLAKATGRFGDEAQRLSDIFTDATRHSLMLLNESLASTNSGESLYIAQDLVRILRRMGTRAIFATHLHELATDVASLNEQTPGDSHVVSLVASRIDSGTDGAQRSYKIRPGQPMGRSYAREIASKYGNRVRPTAVSAAATGRVRWISILKHIFPCVHRNGQPGSTS